MEMVSKEGISKEIRSIIDKRILSLGLQCFFMTPEEIDREADMIFELIISLLKNYKIEGFTQIDAEDVIVQLLREINVDVITNENEIRLCALNNVFCSVTGFCSPQALIW